MEHHWRQAGKNIDRRPGLPWDVALYVPLVVLMLVSTSTHARWKRMCRRMSWPGYLLAARTTPPQLRDHSNIAPAYAALGKMVEEINAVILHVAQDCGFADTRILSSDTTAQELPIGYPNEPVDLAGLGSALWSCPGEAQTRAVVVRPALAQVQTILRTVKEHHLFAKGKQAKRQVLTRLLTEVGQLVVQTRRLLQGKASVTTG